MNCPQCKKSDEIEKFTTIEPQTLDNVKSHVCLRCMCVISSEGADTDAVIYQIKKFVR